MALIYRNRIFLPQWRWGAECSDSFGSGAFVHLCVPASLREIIFSGHSPAGSMPALPRSHTIHGRPP